MSLQLPSFSISVSFPLPFSLSLYFATSPAVLVSIAMSSLSGSSGIFYTRRFRNSSVTRSIIPNGVRLFNRPTFLLFHFLHFLLIYLPFHFLYLLILFYHHHHLYQHPSFAFSPPSSVLHTLTTSLCTLSFGVPVKWRRLDW